MSGSSITSTLLVAASCIASNVATGETWRLTGSNAGKDWTSLTNAYHWADLSSSNIRSGEDGAPLSAEHDYVINGGSANTVNTTKGSSEEDTLAFAGRSLTIGTSDNEGRVRHYLCDEAKMDWDNAGANLGLDLVNGYYILGFGVNDGHYADIYGKIKVSSPLEKPYRFGFAYNIPGVCMRLHGDFSGNADAAVRFAGVNYMSTGLSFINGTTVELHGAWTNYFGHVDVTNTAVKFGTTALPGSVALDGRSSLSTIAADTVFTLDTLSLSSGAKLVVNADIEKASCGRIVVTNLLPIASPVLLDIDESCFENLPQTVYLPVLSAPVSAGLRAEDFKINPDKAAAVARTRLMCVREPGKMLDTLHMALFPEFVRQTVSDANVRDIGTYSSSFDVADHWEGNRKPDEGAGRMYLVSKIDNRTTMLRTPVDKERDYEFPGAGLIIDKDCQFGLFYKSIDVDDLWLMDNAFFMLGNGVAYGTIKGRLIIPSGRATVGVYNKATLEIASDMIGSGRLVFDGSHGNTSSRRGTIKLTGDNSRFTGTMTVGLNREPQEITSNNSQILSISAASQLGAPLAEFDPTALVLKRLARLYCAGSVTFDDTTRGVYIGEDGSRIGANASDSFMTGADGAISVEEGHTVKILSQITLNGRLHKIGKGTLALGGDLKFGRADAIQDTPIADSNNCEVAEGYVKPLSADSFNGMRMTFAEGAGIRIDVNPENEDLRRYGLRNAKTSEPFASPVGKIQVTFDVPDGFVPVPPFAVAVATVQKGVADSAFAMLSIAKPEVGCFMDVIVSEEGDTATLKAEFRKIGFILSVR